MENGGETEESNKVAKTEKRKASKMVLVRSMTGVINGLLEHKIMTKEEEKVLNGVRTRLKEEIMKDM